RRIRPLTLTSSARAMSWRPCLWCPRASIGSSAAPWTIWAPCRPCVPPPRPSGPSRRGQRNNALFEYCRGVVRYCDDVEQLLDSAQTWADNHLATSLPAAEIRNTCRSVWTYRGGRKRIMDHIVDSKAYAALKTKPYALALFIPF